MSRHPEELISLSVDGALSPQEAVRLEAHLADCPECRALAAAMFAVRGELLRTPAARMPVPVRLPAGVPGAADVATVRRAPGFGRPRMLAGGLAGLAVAASVAVAVVVHHRAGEEPPAAAGVALAPVGVTDLVPLPGRPGDRLSLALPPGAPAAGSALAVTVGLATAQPAPADGATGAGSAARAGAAAPAVVPRAASAADSAAPVPVTVDLVDAGTPGVAVGSPLPPGTVPLAVAATTAGPGPAGRVTLLIPADIGAGRRILLVATVPGPGGEAIVVLVESLTTGGSAGAP